MKKISWNEDKAIELEKDNLRGNVSFQEVVLEIEAQRVLDVVVNPSPNYPHQKMYILNIRGYAYCVPFVETENLIFLKTLYPSRKYTAMYLEGK